MFRTTVTSLALLMLLSACGAQPVATPSSAASAAPSAPATAETAASPITDEAAIQQMTLDKLRAEGLNSPYTITIEDREGDSARVRAEPDPSSQIDGSWLYLKKQGNQWQVVAGPGTAFSADDLAAVGIPASLALDAIQPGGDTTLCDQIHEPLAKALNTEVAVGAAPFTEMLSGETRDGCELTATGTGVNFADVWTISQQIGKLLIDNGWQIDQQAVADGPTGTAQGYRNDQQAAIVSIAWQPAPGASCPADRPISDCELQPSQRLFSIRVSMAPEPSN